MGVFCIEYELCHLCTRRGQLRNSHGLLGVAAACSNMVSVFGVIYRQYVLPRPTYNLSDVCSDNSSCPSHPLADHKHSVSSGYESMTLNSAEEAPQGGSDDGKSSKATEKTTSGLSLNISNYFIS